MAAAARELHLSQPSLSTQIRRLEEALDTRLFQRSGRGLRLTEEGKLAFRYADEIFTLGREFVDELKGVPGQRPLRLAVGVSDALPKALVHRILRPAMAMPAPLRLSCREGSPELLFMQLRRHELDLVLADAPAPQGLHGHPLGAFPMAVFGTDDLRRRHPGPFPDCLNGAPLLLPQEGSALRAGLEAWLRREGLRPVVAGDFEDSALMGAFAMAGEGFLAAPEALEGALAPLASLGQVPGLSCRIHLVGTERRILHPAFLAILDRARRDPA